MSSTDPDEVLAGVLREVDVAGEPTDQFATWYAEVEAAGQPEPEAMCLSTAAADGAPSARMVLLKAHDRRGFVFYTNEESRKGGELAANPRAALTWRWSVLDRQVRVTGRVEPASAEEADAYFASRARGSQIGAWASAQSQALASPGSRDSRTVLLAAVTEVESRFAGERVPRPPYWVGYRVVPEVVEFWQGRESRLHDRIRYRRPAAGESGSWIIERLSP